MQYLQTPTLRIAFEAGGPEEGRPVMLLHGWPDDATTWREITPRLEAAGLRWVAPFLRGFGATRFLVDQTPRDGTAAALAHDALDLADALHWDRFAVVGHDWGGRTAYTLAAAIPERIVSITSIAIGYSPRGQFPTPSFEQSRRWWYQWFMTTDGGAAAVRADPVGFARIQWDTWSPSGWFDQTTFDAVAESFRNPDWADVTLNGYRSRWRAEPLDPAYDPLRKKLKAAEKIHVPTLMLQGGSDLCDPPRESEGQDRYFEAGYSRLVLAGVGHFPTREAPDKVGTAVIDHLLKSLAS